MREGHNLILYKDRMLGRKRRNRERNKITSKVI
jgi:hypothetical protein